MSGDRIAIIIPDLSGYGTTRAYIIGEGLKRLGFRVKLYGFLFGREIYPIPPYGLPVTYFYGKPLPSLIKTMWDLTGEIDGDVIYVIKPQMTSFGVGYLKAWRERKPIILDLDDWEMAEWGGDEWRFSFQGDLRKPGHPIYVKFLERILDKVNAITVSSRFLQYRYGGTYLPSVRDTDVFNPSNYDSEKLRQENGLSNYKLLMFTGTAKPTQGIEDILTALDILNNPQLKLVLVGGNCYHESYYQQLWERWGRWLVTIKPQAFDEMARVISLSHIIVFTPHDLITNQAKCPL
ncbi:MAG: group 1 glycosyl transferase, partial [Geminocystis sp.]|nr:group 1 glycosyl transferase [Geminocystis sp.]